MDVKVCGMCGSVMDGNIFFLSYGFVPPEKEEDNNAIISILEYKNYLKKYPDSIIHLDICEKCKQCLEKAIEIRRQECRKLDEDYKNLLDYDRKNPMKDIDGNVKDNT